MSSVPPPSAPPPGDASAAGRTREIVLELAGPTGWRAKLGAGRRGFLRLRGAELTLVAPDVLAEPLSLPGGLVTVAVVDRGRSDGDHGRFVVLRRLGATQVIPREQGIEGWLWSTRQGSAIPAVGGDAPNVALLFNKPLDDDVVERHFAPDWVRAVAERSPLGRPAVPGLLLAVEKPAAAEDAFRQFGVLGDLTDREVPPTMRRHLPGDRSADPGVGTTGAPRAASGSVAPPGMG